MRLFSNSRRAIEPPAVVVSDTQFSTSSCSNIPVEPKHIKYALYESFLYCSGAAESTANQEQTSVSFALMGCHSRIEMKGSTSSSRSCTPSLTRGQLCTKLRLGKQVAAEIMNPSSPTIRCCCGDQTPLIRSIISSGYPT